MVLFVSPLVSYVFGGDPLLDDRHVRRVVPLRAGNLYWVWLPQLHEPPHERFA